MAGIDDVEAFSNAIHQFLERLDVVHKRNEGVVKHADYYNTKIANGVQLFSVLFERDCPIQFDRDLAVRLSLALDQANTFDDSLLNDYDATIAGSIRLAPGIAWAHASYFQGRHVAVLPLPLNGAPRGLVQVSVAGTAADLFFVTRECEHVGFFRSVLRLENANEVRFKRLARSAFPALKWADDVWDGLRQFRRPYIKVRNELIHHLGGLNDHGAACFHEHYASGNLSQLPNALSARIGCETSDENGRTKSDNPSRRDRTRRHCGTDKVFWWHIKLTREWDRIHFLYEPPSGRCAVT